MRYLITGGAGFIGSHITERLLKEGHFVRILDNFSSGKEENLDFVLSPPVIARSEATKQSQSFELIRGDIRDYSTCLRACVDIDYVLHQAALRSVPKSLTLPHEYNEVNIDGTVNMLRAAREKQVKRFVFASSSSVYGDIDTFPQKEDFRPQPISPYALTKLAGEHYCHIFSIHHNLETVCLRYFNVFGPRQSLDDEYAVVIPKFIHCLLNDEQPPIFGNGKQSRDFTYVANVVEANILAATSSSPRHCEEARRADEAISTNGAFHTVLNIANGQDNTVLELVAALNQILGEDIKPQFLPPRAGDVFKTLAHIAKIKEILHYTPKVSFEEGLAKTVEWFTQNGNKPQELEECAGLKRPNRIEKEELSFQDS